MEKVKIEDLKPGDLIYIAWSDAWEADKIPLSNKDYDAVWHEWGDSSSYVEEESDI